MCRPDGRLYDAGMPIDGFSSDKDRSALRAAQLYYMQNLTMDAIANELQTSRSSVSRLLSFARETGLVEIQLKSPVERLRGVQQRFLEEVGVTAHVIPVPDIINDVDRLERVAMSAARIVGSFFDSNMVLGIAWGNTVSAISRHLQEKLTHNSQIVQVNGAGNTRSNGISYASEIMGRFGTAFGADVQQFPVPAFFDDPRAKELLWHERSIRRVLEVQQQMDVVVFSPGSLVSEIPSQVYGGDYLDEAEMELLRHWDVVGDVATVFYRADGSWEDIPMNDRSSGPPLSFLAKVPRRVSVVSGRSKLQALEGALCAGIITDLIIDEAAAHVFLESPAA